MFSVIKRKMKDIRMLRVRVEELERSLEQMR